MCNNVAQIDNTLSAVSYSFVQLRKAWHRSAIKKEERTHDILARTMKRTLIGGKPSRRRGGGVSFILIIGEAKMVVAKSQKRPRTSAFAVTLTFLDGSNINS